jgi:GT2 family glycosyltransferase
MDVSVIIVNYNTFLLASECIDSIFERTRNVDFEIILVDNASTDGSKDLFAKDSRIVFVPLSENMGFGKANNEGFKRATGKYVLCLNPDTLLLNNAIGILCGFMNHHPEVGICGGNLYDADMQPAHSFRMVLPSFWWEVDYHLGYFFSKLFWGKSLEFNYSRKPKSVGYVTGADMMMRRDILDKTGGFSEHFFMYYEECELTYRIKNLGYKVFSVPKAKILHLEGKSFASSELTNKMKYQIYSRWMYRRMCFPSLIYKLLAFYTTLKWRLFRHDDAVLGYQYEVIQKVKKVVG